MLLYFDHLLLLFTYRKPFDAGQFPWLSTANSARFCAENEEILHQKGQSCTLSYTLSFTGKRQYIKRLSWIGVGNVGYFHKTFFREKKADFREKKAETLVGLPSFLHSRGTGRERKSKTSDFFASNIRTFEVKHRNFCPKKSDVFGFRHGFNNILTEDMPLGVTFVVSVVVLCPEYQEQCHPKVSRRCINSEILCFQSPFANATSRFLSTIG